MMGMFCCTSAAMCVGLDGAGFTNTPSCRTTAAAIERADTARQKEEKKPGWHPSREEKKNHQKNRNCFAHPAVHVQSVKNPEARACVEDDSVYPPEQQSPAEPRGIQFAMSGIRRRLRRLPDDGDNQRRQRDPAQ